MKKGRSRRWRAGKRPILLLVETRSAHGQPLRECDVRLNCDSRRVTVASDWTQFLECGSAGTRTRNQRLKRALLYRLSYRPVSFFLFIYPISRWQPTPKAFGAALPIELPTRGGKFLIQFKRCRKICSGAL